MDRGALIAITKNELSALQDFLGALKDERDAIVSFSLEGITQQNNRKENILKRIEFLETEKQAILGCLTDPDAIAEDGSYQALSTKLNIAAREVTAYLEKNRRLLSFSMDHVRSSIDKIIGVLNTTTYGRKPERTSLFLTREV